MKLLSEAAKRLQATPRAMVLLLMAAMGLVIPQMAMAAGEADVVLNFTRADQGYLLASLLFGILALAVGFGLRAKLMAESPGSAKMQEVGLAIREGALAYLLRQVKMMVVFVVILMVGLFFLYRGEFGATVGMWIAVAFLAGVAASYIAGYTGMLMAVNGNMRTANAALTSYKRSLEVAFRSGAVAGLVTVGMGLIGATIILWAGGKDAMKILVGFGFGGSLAALFMRVGGGIFTKAADVGADLVGKVEAGIPEDDPRNPATIADNVGDNVGDCAGMAADVFESYEVTLVAAIILGAATAVIFDQPTWMRLILFALMARGLGILASIIGILAVRGTDDIDADPLGRIRRGFYSSAGVAAVLTLGLAWFMMGGRGNPIQTNTLTSREATAYGQFERVVDVRNRIASNRKVPAYQVTAKEVAADPALQNLDLQPQPGLDPTASKENQIGMMLSQADNFGNLPKPPSLQGYSALTADSTNPAMGYAIQNIPNTEAESRDPKITSQFVNVSDFLKHSTDLKVFQLKITQTPPGGAPMTNTQLIGPMAEQHLKSVIAEQEKISKGLKISIEGTYPAVLYANPQGNLAFGIEGNPTGQSNIRSFTGQNLSYYPIDAKTVNAAQSQTTPGTPPPALPGVKQVATAFVSHTVVPWHMFFWAILFGLGMAFAIEALTDYYVSTHKRPTQEVAGVSSAGPAPMIIQGFAYASESSVFMVFAIVIALLFPLFLFNPVTYGTAILSFYGIALVGLGLLTTTGYVLAMDTFGPISDNAQGVYEMSGEGHDNEYGSKAVQRLDAAGNTTKALTKGFAIATAVVAAVALFHTYLESAQLSERGLPLNVPEIFLGLLIGGAAPYLFVAFAINAVGRASFELINEVRRQFRADAGIMAGTSKPNYGRCVEIVTSAAQRELLGPGILAIALPVAVAFGFSIGKAPVTINGHLYNIVGAQALGGYLVGAILSGQLMAVLLANSGGMWDNAKKIIEDGLYGGKGTDAHKAGVVCDTVGDPFKDTAGPALNPLIKVMNLVALLLAPVIILPFGTMTLVTITVIALAALAFSVYVSKKGSLSSSLQQATGAGHEAAEHHVASPELPGAPEPAVRRRITVDDVTANTDDHTRTP